MENLNSNIEESENYNFNYRSQNNQIDDSNTYIGHVSDNLVLRLSPQRKHSPSNYCCCNHYHTNQCIPSDYCCTLFQQEPCSKCIHNHYIFCENNKKNSSENTMNNIHYINNECEPCQICHNLPCCCCQECHFYPCKCCPKCKLYPCKCCNKCHSLPCICCKNCCEFPCKCCKVCHQLPCQCCPVCHMVQCICCEKCESYPCKCCPDCHFVECHCCINCGCYPCKCESVNICNNCNLNCNCTCNCCCQVCGDVICSECKSNPCRCCPLCHDCGCEKCEHEKECLKNNLSNIDCPMHNVHSMKHNPGCPFEVKCPHEPKCAHKNKNNNNNMNNSSSYNNNPNNMNNKNNRLFNTQVQGQGQGQNRGRNYCPHSANNSQNNNISNDPRYNVPQNKNRSNNNNINNIEENEGNYNINNNEEQNDNSGQYYNNLPNNQYNNNSPRNYPQNQNFENNDNAPENEEISNNANYEGPLSPLSSPYPPDSPYFNIDEPGIKSNWIFCPKCNVYHRCPHPGCEHSPNKRTTTHICIHEDENQNQNNSNSINNNISNNNNSINIPNNNNISTANFDNNNNINSKQNIIFPKNSKNSLSFKQKSNINDNNNININSLSQSKKSISSNKKRGVFSTCPYQEELGQFVDFLSLLMEVESKIEDMKIDLAQKPDFNFEDIFRMFEADGKGYIEPEDLKQGLKLLGLNPSDYDIKLLMKRFDLNRQNLLSYTDFFDMVVSFEKKTRNSVQIRPPNSCCPCKSPDVFECDTLIAIKNLFKFIIECEQEINQRREGFDSLRSKYADVIQFLDYSKRGIINRSDLKLYLTQFNKFTTSKECDLLFIRLDKTRTGEVNIDEIENELMFLR